VRKNANFHALYFTICHGREAGKAAVHNLAGVAQSHGYRVALAQSKLVPLKKAEDVLTMADGPRERAPLEPRNERPSTEASREERRDRAPVEARRYERLDRAPVEGMGRERQQDRGTRPVPPQVAEPEDEGVLSGARRLTNRAFDALDEMGDWVTGRR